MPTNAPTGYETYVYDHKQCPRSDYEGRQHCGPLHNPSNLPAPECEEDSSPLIMIEPCYATDSSDVWVYFREGKSLMLPRSIAEQLRDALIKVCEKPH